MNKILHHTSHYAFALLVACSLLLAACTTTPEGPVNPKRDKEGNIIPDIPNKELGLLIDHQKVVDEGKERAKAIVHYGPQPKEITDKEIRRGHHSIIDMEEAIDYSSISKNQYHEIFSIDMNVENVDIETFMQMMARITNVNFLVSDEVSGLVSAKLVNVPWTSALDSVLSLKSLAKHVDKESNIIRIHSQSNIVALENFERQRQEDLQRTILLEQANEPLYTEVFKLFYSKPDGVKEILEDVLNIGGTESGGSSGLRNTQAQITLDPRMNQLIIKARRDDLDIIAKVIDKIDTRTPQVFIEAFIVEVSDNFSEALGVRMGANVDDKINTFKGTQYNFRTTGIIGSGLDDGASLTSADNSGSIFDLQAAGATSGIGFLIGRGTEALKLELTAMEDEGLTRIVSNPRIFTLDNQEAEIFQGTDVPFQSSSENTGTNIEFKSAGLKLAVTPTIVGDGNLIMSINVTKDSVDTSITNPPITKSEINTNLVTQDGSIVVIGGIYTSNVSQQEARVPLLGDIPVAGRLFKRNSDSDQRSELMVFIAPKIL